MSENWQKVYSHTYIHRIEIARAVLKEYDIDSVVVNNKDSAYLFGEFELYVNADDVLQAKQIILTKKL
ncbi:MAG TPA: DUF2007 domain-containing protein [Bacteroidales bacterium]|nr:DUF2007 domain-containing protein [Bacteroidales bacterium]